MQFNVQKLTNSQKSKLKKAIDQYLIIQNEFDNDSIPLDKNPEFQKAFTDLYRLREGSWGNELIMRSLFFKYFEMYRKFMNNGNMPDYSYILNDLSYISDKTEKSFASKILHTLDNEKPILDSKVINQLNKEFPNKFSGLIKPQNKKYSLPEAKALYDAIVNCYNSLVNDANSQSFESNFDKEFKTYSSITLIKKIDFYLWVL